MLRRTTRFLDFFAMTPVPSSAAAPLLGQLVQQLHRFFHQLDERRYDAMLAQFTHDGRWLRQGQWLDGREAIGAALKARAGHVQTLHVMTNAYVADMSDDQAVLEAYMTAYRYTSVDGGAVARIAGPSKLNRVHTVFRRDAGHDWRIAEQQMVAALAFVE